MTTPRRARIGSVAKVTSGHPFRSDQWTPDGVPAVKIANVKNGYIDLDTAPAFVSMEDSQAIGRFLLQQGDIVISMTGDVGRVARIITDSPLVLNQRVGLFTVDSTKADPLFFFYTLRTTPVRQEIVRTAFGSAQANTSPSLIEQVQIPLPPLETQRAIAEVLGALDDKIAANRRVVELGHDLGTTICKSAEAKPRPLINVADIVMGTSPRGDQLNELGSGVPFFQGVRDFGSVFPSTRVYTSSPQRMATAGSILFSVRAPVGQTNLAVGDVCIGRGLAALHTQEQPATLYFSLKAYPEVWDIYSGGGTVFSSITGKELQQTLVPMPDAFMTSDVELKLSALLKRLVAAERENQVLASTRDELLPLLMSGRITVGAASSRVEEVV